MMVGPSGPSPTGQSVSNANMVPNPGLSPFGQPQMSSQANLTTTTASVTTSQFPTSNGTAGLPNSSPIHNQNQFDIMKVRLAAVRSYSYLNIRKILCSLGKKRTFILLLSLPFLFDKLKIVRYSNLEG